jgi:uncharacterized protein
MILARRASLALLAGLCMAGCSSSPSPPVRYYRLRIEPPAQAKPPTGAGAAKEVWQLMTPVRMPDYLDRDELWFATGSNALQALDGHRWLEPLRDAVPRILVHDLAELRGSGNVWSGSVPTGVVVTKQIRLELLEFTPDDGRRAVRLRARWTSTDPAGSSPAQVSEAAITAPSAGSEPAQLVDAHRLALWRLAERMAARNEP